MLGICNGFQLLTESGLLPGVLLKNKYLRFICSNVYLNIKNNSKYFFKKIKKKTIELHIAHNDGCYYVDKKEIKKIEDNNQIALKYCNKEGDINEDSLVNIQDVILLVNISLSVIEPNEHQIIAGDINEDGIIDILDIISCINIILGS